MEIKQNLFVSVIDLAVEFSMWTKSELLLLLLLSF
jgi:hypothetical protein